MRGATDELRTVIAVGPTRPERARVQTGEHLASLRDLVDVSPTLPLTSPEPGSTSTAGSREARAQAGDWPRRPSARELCRTCSWTTGPTRIRNGGCFRGEGLLALDPGDGSGIRVAAARASAFPVPWAAHVEPYGGLRTSSDRLRELDDWGLETTRRLLRPVPATPFPGVEKAPFPARGAYEGASRRMLRTPAGWAGATAHQRPTHASPEDPGDPSAGLEGSSP